MSFSDFWTNKNNPSLDKSVYLYGTRHIIVLILTLIACIALTLIFYNKSERAKKILFRVNASILLFFEVSTRIVNIIIEENITFMRFLEIMLPMHICSVMVWVFIAAIFSRKQFLINYSVIGGFLATIAFLLYPAVGLNKTYITFTCIYSIFSHMLGFITVILLMTLKQARFEFKKIWQPFVCFAIMFAWGAICNFLIFPGSDYMYMINDPLELDLNFPYQILYAGIIVVYTCIFYVVNTIIRAVKNKKTKGEKTQPEKAD